MNLNNYLEDSEDFPISLKKKNKNESEGFFRRTEAVHELFLKVLPKTAIKQYANSTARIKMREAGIIRPNFLEVEDWIVEDLINRYMKLLLNKARSLSKR